MTNREKLIEYIRGMDAPEFKRDDITIFCRDSTNKSLRDLCLDGVIKISRIVRSKGGMTNYYTVVDLNKRRIKPGEVVYMSNFTADAWRSVYPQLFIAHPTPVNARVIRHE